MPSVPTVNVWLAREAARHAAQRKLVGEDTEKESSSSSTSEKGAAGGRPGEDEEWEERLSHCIESFKVMEAQGLGAMCQKVACALPEKSKAHRTLIVQVNLVLVRLRAAKELRLR